MIKIVKLILICIILAIPFLLPNSIKYFKTYFNAKKFVTTNSTPEIINGSPEDQSMKTEVINTEEEKPPVDYEVVKVLDNLFVPWSIVFTSNDRFLFTERNGNIKEYKNNALTPAPLIHFENVSTIEEEGLMGLALDPDYNKNKWLYASYAYSKDGSLYVKIEKLRDEETSIKYVSTILDKIPAAKYHAGSRLKFGPDKKLYATTGDATDGKLAQKLDSLAGKILRIDTSIKQAPSDNPFPSSYVYSYGHRNPQGIDWHPESGYLIETEHGPSTIDGPPGGDEVNFIEPGKNYGWPLVSHDETKFGLEPPLIQYTPAIAPASGVFYNSSTFPQFKNIYFFGGLKGEGIYWVSLDKFKRVIKNGKLPDINYGRIREIAVSPNGEIYFSTSNKDGRGAINEGDDKIYKITPKIM